MSQLSIFKGKKFYPLFWTQFFGAFNDNFLKNALIILVTYRSATVFGLPASEIVALAGGIFILPFFLFSALAGQVADKFEKGLVIRWIKGIEIAIMIFATLGLVGGHFSFLLAVLFLMGLHSTFFGPIKYSILPQHLPERELVAGNALVEAGTFIAILIGTIAGGILIGGESGPWIVSIGLLLVAVAGYLICRLIPHAPAAQPELKLQYNPIQPTWEMIGFARETRSVFLSIMGISWFWFMGASLLSLFPPLCKDVLKADEHLVTLFLGVFSVGTAAGSMLCERLSRKRLELGLVPLGSIGLSIFAAGFGWLSATAPVPEAGQTTWQLASSLHGAFILADLFALSVFSGFFIVPLYTMMQERSEASHRSRVIAANNIINALFMVTASVFLIVLLHFKVSIPSIILTLAILNAGAAVYIYSLLPEFLLRFCTWILANVLYRLRVSGDDKIPHDGGAVLVCNHVSFVDWMIIAAGIRRPVRFVMHHSYFKGFLIKHLMRGAKVIPIAGAKEDPKILEQAFAQIAKDLRDGELVCIFPEGRITADGELGEFRPGITRILEQTPVPVVPMALNGLWGSLFSRKDKALLKKRPRRFWSLIELRIGAPISPDKATLERLRNEVASLSEAS